ncbi:vacuolar protein sorting-associated protein 37B-like [Babylonia areolata]|uniref:vacuolar protein sorting-associated protein 37B-like n=1 Tax=Babylonia areolata TaxID=304850 RepID=UPI003FD229BA
MYNHYNNYYGSGQSGAPGASGVRSANIMGRMDETAAVALLQHLGKEDLEHLMADDSKLNDLIQDLQQIRGVQSDHDDLVAQNKSLAEYNLSLQPRLDSLKTEVATGYESLNKLKTQLGMDKAQLDEYVGNQKLDTLHALLQTAAAEVEEECEKLTDSFCEQNTSVEDFLAQYIPSRTAGHKRRIKAEKMGELLREGGLCSPWSSQSQGQVGSSADARPPYPMGSGAPPYPVGAGSGGGGVPYPVGGGYGMPQPSVYRH